MDTNVKRLLEEEAIVNQKVRKELDGKNELMKSIKQEVEIANRTEKKKLEAEFQKRVEKVSHISLRPRLGQSRTGRGRQLRHGWRLHGRADRRVRGEQGRGDWPAGRLLHEGRRVDPPCGARPVRLRPALLSNSAE